LNLRRLLGQVSAKISYRRAATVFGGLLWRGKRRWECRQAVRRSVEGPLPPVLVYLMAKVGSSTITSALQNIEGLHVFQVHMLNPDNLRLLRSKVRQKGLARFQMDMDIIGRALFEGIIRPGLKAKIITLVREPISRNVSLYFQNLDVLWETADAHEHVELSRLLGEFHDRFDHYRSLNWFDTEFKPVLGVDVYEYEFPHDALHLRINTGRYDILIMRSDLEDASKAKCIEDFVGVEGLSLAPKNVSSRKPYAAAYRKFLDAVELREGYVGDMLDSKYTRHFFSPEEIASLRTKWLGGGVTKNPAP
jgi:hypothetical protein